MDNYDYFWAHVNEREAHSPAHEQRYSRESTHGSLEDRATPEMCSWLEEVRMALNGPASSSSPSAPGLSQAAAAAAHQAFWQGSRPDQRTLSFSSSDAIGGAPTAAEFASFFHIPSQPGVTVSNEITAPRARKLRLLKLALLQGLIVSIAGCGGGGGYGGDGDTGANQQASGAQKGQVQVADAQFADATIEGLGFRVDGDGGFEGKTDAAGKFRFLVGRPVQFFLDSGGDRLVIGTATPAAVSGGVTPFTLHDLAETQNDGDEYLGNLVNLLTALDANADLSDGVVLDANAQAAVATAAGGKKVNFAQSAKAFAKDSAVTAAMGKVGRSLTSNAEALAQYSALFRQGRSSTIALTRDDTRAVVVNRQKGTVSVIRVRDEYGADASNLLAEVPVGKEPRFVALSPDDTRAYVTNAVDGTISVIDLASYQVVGSPVHVGVEPRGIAVTPNGTYAFIANHTVGEVTIVKLATYEVVRSIKTGGNPYAIAITNDGDHNDRDERVFVTRLFGELIDPARPDGFDDAKQGVIDSFWVGEAVDGVAQVSKLLLKPLDSGFTADRRSFCLNTRKALQAAGTTVFFNSGVNRDQDGASQLAQATFCPDVNSTDASDTGAIAKTAQTVYPNMLFSALVRGPLLYVPNVGAQPEPPVRFNVNVQGLVGVLSRTQNAETAWSTNLNIQVAKETQPAAGTETTTLDRVFLNDLVALDADRDGKEFLFVSRGGNYVLRAKLGDDGKLNILDAANKATRIQTGNLPSGVVMSWDGRRAYTNNELNTSITAIDLENNQALARDIESSTPPAPGTVEHRRLFGKLAFFTALGVPDVIDTNGDGGYDVPLRDIDPLQHRNKASDNGWSSCASCHDDGHSDNVTWIFETGPRQTIQLEGTFARLNLNDSRLMNWSAVRGSNTDFNNNARGIQGGKGFATDVRGVDRTAEVFNHGPVLGISDSLDAIQEWVTTVRAPIVPDLPAATEQAGRYVFETQCAACHGGAKWTKSQTSPVFTNNPTFAEDPIGVNFFAGVKPIDPGVTAAGPQIVSVTRDGKGTLTFLDKVGTFNPANPLELRGAAAVAGQSTQGFASFGGLGFNSPSLFGLSLSAPYFHDGSAQSLEDVAKLHQLPDGRTIEQTLPAQDLWNLLQFVRSIDEQTQTVESATDRFLKQY
jgi:YVTN family beta-propeller protein